MAGETPDWVNAIAYSGDVLYNGSLANGGTVFEDVTQYPSFIVGAFYGVITAYPIVCGFGEYSSSSGGVVVDSTPLTCPVDTAPAKAYVIAGTVGSLLEVNNNGTAPVSLVIVGTALPVTTARALFAKQGAVQYVYSGAVVASAYNRLVGSRPGTSLAVVNGSAFISAYSTEPGILYAETINSDGSDLTTPVLSVSAGGIETATIGMPLSPVRWGFVSSVTNATASIYVSVIPAALQ